MTTSDFLQRLRARGLWLEVSTETGKLAIYGDAENLTERICDYIRSNRDALIAALAVETEQAAPTAPVESPIAHEPEDKISYLPCHLAEYGLCSNRIVEQDASTWRVSPDGLVFCVECWQARNLAQAALAIPYLADHNQPTDLEQRIEEWNASPGCASCGGHDWIIDDGFLVCRCLLEKRAKNAHLDWKRANTEAERKRSFQTIQPTKQKVRYASVA